MQQTLFNTLGLGTKFQYADNMNDNRTFTKIDIKPGNTASIMLATRQIRGYMDEAYCVYLTSSDFSVIVQENL